MGKYKTGKGRPTKDILPASPAERVGRPHKVINHEIFEELCRIQCTLKEIASVFKVDEGQIIDFCKRKYGKTFGECKEIFSSDGKVSVKRELYRKALSNGRDSLGAIVWWSKNHMGYSDKVETHNVNENMNNDGKVEVLVNKFVELLGGKSEQSIEARIVGESKVLSEGASGVDSSEGNAGVLSKKPV